MISATKKPVPSTHHYHSIFFSSFTKTPNSPKPITTLPIQHTPNNSPSLTQHHKSLCFTLADQLFSQGLVPSAQGIIDRLIKHSPSPADAFSTVEFATSKGIGYNSSILLQQLLNLNKPHVAEEVFEDVFLGRALSFSSFSLCDWRRMEMALLGFSRQVVLKAWQPDKWSRLFSVTGMQAFPRTDRDTTFLHRRDIYWGRSREIGVIRCCKLGYGSSKEACGRVS